MKAKDVSINKIYSVKVSGKVVPVRLLRESPYGGWVGVNMVTRREVRLKTAGKLRKELSEETVKEYLSRIQAVYIPPHT